MVGFEGRRRRRGKEGTGVPEIWTQPSAAVGAVRLSQLDLCVLCVTGGSGFTQLTLALCFADSHLADPESPALQYSLLEYAEPSCSSQSCTVARC